MNPAEKLLFRELIDEIVSARADFRNLTLENEVLRMDNSRLKNELKRRDHNFLPVLEEN